MNLRARPGLHHAPLPDGVHVSGTAGDFSLRGSEVLHLALDALVPVLRRGAEEDELVATLGGEPARPLVRALVSQLLDHDLLLDLDHLSVPPPTAAVRGRHTEALAHLESFDADPYATFERLQRTVVRLRGVGAPAEAARRGLTRAGVGLVLNGDAAHERPADLLVDLVVPGPGSPDLTGGGDAHEADVARVVVRLAEHVGLVATSGPDVADDDLWHRARAWATRLDRGPLPRPGADQVAAGYAVVVALELLTANRSAGEAPAAVVLSGTDARAERVPLGRRGARVEHSLTREVGRTTRPPEDEVLRRLAEHSAAAWVGGHDARGGLHLPQLPTALRLGVPVAHDGPVRLAPGADQEEAALALTLQMRRDAGGEAGAAGISCRRWLLDGALRLLAPRAVPLPDDPSRRQVPGLGWTLAACEDRVAWAPTGHEAAADARALALAAAEAARTPEAARVADLGTDALARASEELVDTLLAEVLALARSEGFQIVGVRAIDDPALPAPEGGVALWSGSVRLERSTR